MFDGLIVGAMARVIAESVDGDILTEIRLRVGKRLLLLNSSDKNPRIYPRIAGGAYVVTKEEIDGIVARATNMSPYSVSDEMIRGYIPSKKVRIGVGGEGVSDGGKLLNLKNVSYLVIRVPHQILNAADGIIDSVYCKDSDASSDDKKQEVNFAEHCDINNADNGRKTVRNTLIISPPSGGKTTMLRELARILSKDLNVVVIDERYELACVCEGVPTLDIGESDVISGVPKTVAYENCIRAMNPDVIVTDEIFRESEVGAICDVLRSGVNVIASVHGSSVDELAKSDIYSDLLKRFDLAVVLGKHPVGVIKEIVNL